jgi:hypothetical protein
MTKKLKQRNINRHVILKKLPKNTTYKKPQQKPKASLTEGLIINFERQQ